MSRRRLSLPLLTSLGLVAVALPAAPALAAPTPAPGTTRQASVVCDQLGEVTLDITGPLTAPGAISVHGGGPVRLAGAPSVHTTATTGSTGVASALDQAGTTAGIACTPLTLPTSAGAVAPAGTVKAAGMSSSTSVTATLGVRVLVDADAVVSAAANTPVHPAAAIANDPAGYGPVVAFPYQSQLASYLAGRSGSAAVAYRGTGSKTIYAYAKGESTNVTASIVKVQVMATVMYQAQQAGRGLTAWEKSQMVPMIRNSDNNATTALWDHVGRGPAVATVLARMGLRQTTPGSGSYWGLTVTSAPDQVVLVDHFSRSNPVLSAANRAYGLSLMRSVSSDQDWGVTAGPGDDIAVKNGWLPRSDGWHVNSVGFNHKAPRSYSAAVLTHSSSASMGTQVATIEGASRIIWSHQVAVRGDWTGDGHADLLGIKGSDLYLFRADSSGRLGSPTRIGSGWGGVTWIGTPGDVTRDGITDLLARTNTGALVLYKGNGNGTVSMVRTVGRNWNGMTAFATVGDFDGDRTPDLLARSANGDLLRYALPSSGGAVAKGRVGTSWKPMVAILGSTGVNNDLLGDVLAMRSDGKLFAYTSTGRQLVGGKEVGHGWQPKLVAGPGDLTGDTIDDVAYQTSRGLVTYQVQRGGAVTTGSTNPGTASGFRLLG